MKNEELLENLKTKYETVLAEDADITNEIKKLSKERYELCCTDKIENLKEKELILKNGKSFKGIIKSLFKCPNGKPIDVLINVLNYFCAFLVIGSVNYIISIRNFSGISKIIAHILAAIITTLIVSIPVFQVIYINKVNKKYNLEEVSLELENAKKRREIVGKELKSKKSLHEIKQQKLDELENAIKSIKEIMDSQTQTDNYNFTSEQTVELDTYEKEEGKTLKLERK